MRTQSIFQILLGIACLGLSVSANVFWPFAHSSYLIGFFTSSLVSDVLLFKNRFTLLSYANTLFYKMGTIILCSIKTTLNWP